MEREETMLLNCMKFDNYNILIWQKKKMMTARNREKKQEQRQRATSAVMVGKS